VPQHENQLISTVQAAINSLTFADALAPWHPITAKEFEV